MTEPRPAVFFLSDYGTADEFVGVVHAVLHRLAPDVPVIDLSHEVAPFDVAGGAAMLVRCAPFLGAGVVLAVVDPGVGTARRAVVIRTRADQTGLDGPNWLVGPDNGLLLPMAAASGGVESAFLLGAGGVSSAPVGGSPSPAGPTFAGRDVFAPAAARLALGVDPGLLGPGIEPGSLVSVPPSGVGVRTGGAADGSSVLTSVASVDRFGNLQLEAGVDALEGLGMPSGGLIRVAVVHEPAPRLAVDPGAIAGGPAEPVEALRVSTFAELGPGQPGLLIDSSGHLALVLDRASAATFFHPVGVGSGVIITGLP